MFCPRDPVGHVRNRLGEFLEHPGQSSMLINAESIPFGESSFRADQDMVVGIFFDVSDSFIASSKFRQNGGEAFVSESIKPTFCSDPERSIARGAHACDFVIRACAWMVKDRNCGFE